MHFQVSFVTLVIAILCLQIGCSSPGNSSWESCPQEPCTVKTNDALKHLNYKETVWISKIRDHIDYITPFLQLLQRHYERFSNITAEISTKQEYMGNVMNSFSLLKRSSKDWKLVAKTVHTLPGSFNPKRRNKLCDMVYNDFAVGEFLLRKSGNIRSGIRALSRLQSIYHISADELANGKLEGALRHTRLTARDCYDVAMYYCEKSDYFQCTNWLEEAMKKIDDKDDNVINRKDVLEQHFLAKCSTGDILGSTLIFKKLMEEFPDMTPTDSLLACSLNMKQEHGSVTKLLKGKEMELCNYEAFNVRTKRLLRCRYIHRNMPQLMIGPFKMEEMHLDPPIVLFHRTISDAEIEELVEFGTPVLKQAHVFTSYGKNRVDEISRTSYAEWLGDDEKLPLLSRLSKRTALFTGFNPYMSETNQLANYGLAGEFKLHIDATAQDPPVVPDYSIVFSYLNNVEKGGHTIFPVLNVSLAPVKGSSLVWFNRKPDGTPDQDLIHAGCPVLQGYKWVLLNTVFETREQDFPKCTDKKNSSFKYYYM